MRNKGTYGTLTGMSFLYVTLGKLLISLLTALFGYIILNSTNREIEDPAASIFVFFFIGFIIGSAFMSIYSKTSDSLVLLFALE